MNRAQRRSAANAAHKKLHNLPIRLNTKKPNYLTEEELLEVIFRLTGDIRNKAWTKSYLIPLLNKGSQWIWPDASISVSKIETNKYSFTFLNS